MHKPSLRKYGIAHALPVVVVNNPRRAGKRTKGLTVVQKFFKMQNAKKTNADFIFHSNLHHRLPCQGASQKENHWQDGDETSFRELP